MTPAITVASGRLKQSIKDEASRLGFTLAGFTSPEPPPHLSAFGAWLDRGRHAGMTYLAGAASRARRADPLSIMADCKSILVLAAPYSNPAVPRPGPSARKSKTAGRIAAYAWGEDYHAVFRARLHQIVRYVEHEVGHPVASRWYTDTGPILERDLAQRAGLGWIGKNTCLINPRQGSYFLLAEILLDLDLETDTPFATDHCGTCTRCIQACPTGCILPDRTLDAGRCISYLTIELRDDIPVQLRPMLGNWVFGCDVCQIVCPWNRFAQPEGDSAFRPRSDLTEPDLIQEMGLDQEDFALRFRGSPVKRAKRAGYLRNVAVALGNSGDARALPLLKGGLQDSDELVRRHASWAAARISRQADASA